MTIRKTINSEADGPDSGDHVRTGAADQLEQLLVAHPRHARGSHAARRLASCGSRDERARTSPLRVTTKIGDRQLDPRLAEVAAPSARPQPADQQHPERHVHRGRGGAGERDGSAIFSRSGATRRTDRGRRSRPRGTPRARAPRRGGGRPSSYTSWPAEHIRASGHPCTHPRTSALVRHVGPPSPLREMSDPRRCARRLRQPPCDALLSGLPSRASATRGPSASTLGPIESNSVLGNLDEVDPRSCSNSTRRTGMSGR